MKKIEFQRICPTLGIIKQTLALMLALVCLAGFSAQAANILLVSDNPGTGDNAFHPALIGFPDDFYAVMLQNAGHNVRRFNPPNSQNTQLTAAQIAAINTNDLIVISRSIGSGGFQAPQSTNWNTRITKPIICTSPYLVRPDGNRLSWFTGGTLPDTTPPTRLRGVDTSDPETDFLFSDVLMSGDTMVESYDEPLERNTSVITNPLQPGGKSLAQATFVPLAGGAAVTGHFVAEFPAGMTIPAAAGGTLAGYRMFVAAGSRELSDIPLGAGRDNLTPAGEAIFMRCVQLALNNGVAPGDPNAPIGIQTQPASQTVPENSPVTFSVVVTGAPPRTVQWERDAGDGTYTNVPNASTAFQKSAIVIPSVTPADNGALYRVIASNAFGMVTSEVAQLTVIIDTVAPTIVASVGKWTMTNITVSFSEPVTALSAQDALNYSADNGLSIDSATLDATGTNVLLRTSPQTSGTVYTVLVSGIVDRAAAGNTIAENSPTSFTAFVPAPGFWVSEMFLGIPGNAVSSILTNVNYPDFPGRATYINISSNPPAMGDNYGGRLVGWVVPPVDGNYSFAIRGDDGTDLRFSASADPAGRATIASATAANQPYVVSAAQPLTAGQMYFIEALWKEGTGGDYVQVGWVPPWTTNIESISGTALLTYADGVGKSVSIVTHPQPASITEYRSVTFNVGASAAPAGSPVSYQWQKGDGAGGFTNVPGAPNSATFVTPLLIHPDDDGSQWRVIVAVPGASAISDVATVAVADDTQLPQVLGAGSLDGLQIGICFDEALIASSVDDPFAFSVNGGTVDVIERVLRPDGKTVRLKLSAPISGNFEVSITSVSDLAGNFHQDPVVVNGTVVGLSGAELGTNLRIGEHWTCESGSFEIVGGGADIWGTSDTAHWASRNITGDFDAQVRVKDLTLTAATGGALIAKAGLMVRDTSAANSPTIWLLGNPLPPGRDLVEAGYRATAGGNTANWGPNETNVHIPNMWLRITRSGNLFNGYASSNGTDWTLFATTNRNAPSSLLLGLAVTAHNNVAGLASTGRFSNFSVTQPVADVSITQSASPAQTGVGSQVTYTITVNNAGPDTANGVTVSNPIITGSTHVSSTASQGACTLAGGVVTCNLGSLASGASATVTLVTRMDAAGSQVNTATVSSGAVDPDPLNNTASATVRVIVRPTLSSNSYDGSAGTFSTSFATENGVSYRVEYKNQLSDATWTLLTTVTGDGTVKSITDPGPLPPTRFYQVVINPITP